MNRLQASPKYGLLITVLIWTLFPIYWMVIVATQTDLFADVSLFPRSVTWEHVISVFTEENYLGALINSFTVTAISLLIVLALACPAHMSWHGDPFGYRSKKRC